MFKKLNNKKWLTPFLIGIASTLVINYVLVTFIVPDKSHNNLLDKAPKLIEVVQAEEIYPELVCTCCGKPLDPNDICCGIMKNMINYVDQKVAERFSKDEILMSAVKEFGFNALAKESTKQELRDKLLAQAPEDSPRIALVDVSKDLGELSQSDGIVNTSFELTNQGKSDLVINKLSSSCGCTSAAIVYKGIEGPSFTMPGHGKINPENWQVSIAPGDSAQLKVYYDPMAHGLQKEDSLDITRTVSIFSNDPVGFEAKVKIELVQIP